MTHNIDDVTSRYKEKYTKENYFKYRAWVYKPFIKALARKARLNKEANILDAGCGQGYFTHLLAELGFNVIWVDLSIEGIAAAKKITRERAAFKVGDVLGLPYRESFDCVFVRGCSLYNSLDFSCNPEPTQTLLTYIKPSGCLIFDYHTNLSPRKHSNTWLYHSLAGVNSHFSRYLRRRYISP
jgi:SAM-dependent methyltransferase